MSKLDQLSEEKEVTREVIGKPPPMIILYGSGLILWIVLVLLVFSWIIYVPFLSFLVTKFRMNRSKTLVYLPLSFFVCYNCFTIAADMEYGMLCLISGTLVYFVFMYPILKLKF